MRDDMAKVIVERPRHGSRGRTKGKGYDRRQQRLSWDEQPRREGIRHRSGHTKHFNEHLSPLVRFLHSNVGRPWDKVFSEICAHINRDSAVQDHVRDHVFDVVVTKVQPVNGVPCYAEGRMRGRPIEGRRAWHSLYVCPRTGLLRAVPPRPPRTRPALNHPPIRVSDTLCCIFRDGAWHLVEVRSYPDVDYLSASRAVDVLFGRPVRELVPELLRKQYGASVYAISCRKLKKRELRQWPIPLDQQ